MRLPIYDKPRIICAAEERDGYLALPRCCESDLTELLENAGAAYEIVDKTCRGNPLRVSFRGTLREEQMPAADALLAQDNGVLSGLWENGHCRLSDRSAKGEYFILLAPIRRHNAISSGGRIA